MTDEQTVERVARAIYTAGVEYVLGPFTSALPLTDEDWENLRRPSKGKAMFVARAAIAAMGKVSVSEAAKVLADHLDEHVPEVYLRVPDCSDISVDAMETYLRALATTDNEEG